MRPCSTGCSTATAQARRVSERLRYRSADGRAVVLAIDWPDDVELVAPPTIDFYDYRADERVPFVIDGDDVELPDA